MNQEHDHPIAGVNYPRTLPEFDEWFATEKACIEYLIRLRWPDGFYCPGCGHEKAWTTARGTLRCAICHRQTSPTAGTIFDGTRKPLRTWFGAMWHVTCQKSGGSAMGLQRTMGLRSYQTAWAWLHKLRRAMVRPGREQLSGLVEIDETYIGGEEAGRHGRRTSKKAIVVIAVELLQPKGFGRIRVQRVADVSSASLMPFVCQAVRPGSTVHTDGWNGYNALADHCYTRKVSIIAAGLDPAHVVMPGVHRVASLLKRWLLGTHQGAVSNRHLDYYLDEFTFRFNRRHSGSRGLLFYRLLQQAANSDPVIYRRLIGGKGLGERSR